jgi:translation initiation factor IF-2
MTEKPQAKKKIYQVAKDINISHETLIDYLTKKGHAIKSHMTVVDDTMMHDILSHFKKDKEVAEKHQKKIQTIRDSRKKVEAKTVSVDEAKPKPKSTKKEVEVEVVQSMTAVEAPVLEVDLLPEVELEHPEDVQSTATPELNEEEVGSPPVESIVEEPQEIPAEKVKKQPEILARRTPKMGLKIKGKIDLEEVNRSNAVHEGATGEEAAATEAESKSEDLKKKKKKKKRIKSETAPPTVEEADELLRKSKKKKKLKYREVDQKEVKDAIKRTFAEMEDAGAVVQRATFKRKRKEKRAEEEQRHLEEMEKEKSILRVTEFVSVNELANLMGVPVAEIIKKCIELGLMVSINQRLDKDTITLVADEYGLEVRFVSELTDDAIPDEPEDESALEPRPPIVTIMGHVDHGKTSLLDYIRQSNVVAGEAGGITQHIGAYSVTLDVNKNITFLDTPGHEAFTAMRARGAQLTDIVILVVAADDSVMPQTVEAISHAQAANVPIIIAINKTDKPESNPDRIRQQLSEKNVLVEEWGGKYQCVEISARTGKNVDLLLEKVLLEAEVLDLKANPKSPARGVVIEAQVDKGKGTVATILVQKGMLKIGDSFIAGIQSGKVRAMFDERGRRIEVARPSTPAQVLGFDGVPQAGDSFVAVPSDREAREISLRRQQLKREQDFRLIRSDIG